MSRNIALDILKLLMAFMVVGTHARFLSDFTSLGQQLTCNGLFRIAVPSFSIISGFYFYSTVVKSNQITWLRRTFIIYSVWMISYSYFWFPTPELSFNWLATLAYKVIIGYHHLWYISGIIGAAAILIALRKLPTSILIMTIILTFSIGVLIQYLGRFRVFEGSVLYVPYNYYWINRNMLFLSYPFFCIGYLIRKHDIHNILSFNTVVFFSILGVLLLLSESYFNYYYGHRYVGLDNLFSLLVACPFVVIFFMKTNILGEGKNIALCSSAIYFIHPFFLIYLKEFTEIGATPLTLLVFLLSTLAAYFIIKVNRRLKFIL